MILIFFDPLVAHTINPETMPPRTARKATHHTVVVLKTRILILVLLPVCERTRRAGLRTVC